VLYNIFLWNHVSYFRFYRIPLLSDCLFTTGESVEAAVFFFARRESTAGTLFIGVFYPDHLVAMVLSSAVLPDVLGLPLENYYKAVLFFVFVLSSRLL